MLFLTMIMFMKIFNFDYHIFLSSIPLPKNYFLMHCKSSKGEIKVLGYDLNFYLYFIFKKYFKSRYASIESVYKNKSRKKFILFGVVFWLGSFLLFGLVGYNYTKKRKLIREKQSIQDLFPTWYKYEGGGKL